MDRTPSNIISVVNFNARNDQGIEVAEKFYTGTEGALDQKDTATVTKEIIYEGKSYKPGDEISWNDPLYQRARDEYIEKFGYDNFASLRQIHQAGEVSSVKDPNAQAIGKYLRLVGPSGDVQEVPPGYQFKTGDKIAFHVGPNPSSVLRISGPETAALVIHMADKSGFALIPQKTGGLGQLHWIIEKPGSYSIEYSHSGGNISGQEQRGRMMIEVAG